VPGAALRIRRFEPHAHMTPRPPVGACRLRLETAQFSERWGTRRVLKILSGKPTRLIAMRESTQDIELTLDLGRE
jgi:hypothetical protein